MGVVGRLDQYASMLAWEFDDYSMSENLLTYSEQFNDASWAKNNYNVTANATTAPDGTLTADKLIAINASTFHDLFKSPSLGSNTYTLSIFAKAAEQSFIQVRIDDGVLSRVAMFNLSTGSVSSSLNVTSPTITSYPNGWYRCSITVTSAIVNVVFNGFPTSSNANYSGDGVSGVFIWGAQFERSSVVTDYTPTTTTAINRVLPETTNTNITGLGTYYSSGFDENVGFTTFLSANVFAPYDPVYDEFSGTSFGAGQGRYMRQNTDKSVIVYNEIDEVTDFYGRGIVRDGLVLDLDAGNTASYSGSGTTWTDLSASGNNGTLTNGPTYSSANGGAIVFDGTNDFVSTNFTQPLSNFTVVCWFRKLDATYWNAIFGSDVWNAGTGYAFYFSSSSSLVFAKAGFSGTSLTANPSLFGNISNFNCYAATVDSLGNCSIFVNGSTAATGTITLASQVTKPIIIGCRYSNDGSGTADRSNVQISNFSFYNRTLSATEIQQNYNALRHRFGL